MSPSTESGPEGERAESPTTRERRRNPRVVVPWPAIVQSSDGRLVAGEVIDVSLSGMKLRVNADVTVGDAVRLRLTLPRGAGDVEVTAEVVRRDPGGIGVDFGTLPPDAALKVKAFVPSWDLRRRSERVSIELPIQVQGHEATTKGRTVDLSAVGTRVTTETRFRPGDMVAATFTLKDGQGAMQVRAVVWEVDARGAVLVFANLSSHDFVRLRSFVDSLLARD